MTLQIYGNFQGCGRIDIATDGSSGKIVGVCLWGTPESHEGSYANELKQIGTYYKALGCKTLM